MMTADTVEIFAEAPQASRNSDDLLPYEAPAIRALREAWQRGEPLRRASWAVGIDYKRARRLASAWRARGLRPESPDPTAFVSAPPPRIPELQEARRDGVGVLEPNKAERAERHAPGGPNPTAFGANERARREALKQRTDVILAGLPRDPDGSRHHRGVNDAEGLSDLPLTDAPDHE